jgi:hypothetical protein
VEAELCQSMPIRKYKEKIQQSITVAARDQAIENRD